jgi:hypothetical protein
LCHKRLSLFFFFLSFVLVACALAEKMLHQ